MLNLDLRNLGNCDRIRSIQTKYIYNTFCIYGTRRYDARKYFKK